MRRSGVRPRSYRGTRPRFASGTLMSHSDDTAPQHLPKCQAVVGKLRRLAQNLSGILFSSFIRGSHLLDEVLFLFEESGHIGV